MKITRREFLKYSIFGTSSLLFPFQKILSAKELKNNTYPDLVGVKGGLPQEMFQAGIKALGGMDRFVKKGQTVLVKPNIGWDKEEKFAANTNPALIGEIIKEAYKAGASKVYVFDNSCNLMEDTYKNSGIKKAVEENSGIMKPSDNEKYYISKQMPKNKILKSVKIHELYLKSDVIINVPILKVHGSATMTAGIKNLMGVVWDRRFWHREGLHQCIAEFPLYKKPHLNIIDAYKIMIKNGPRGVSIDDVELKKIQILSTDIVLADTACVSTLGLKTKDVKYLKLAEALGLGSTDLKSKQIKRISLS